METKMLRIWLLIPLCLVPAGAAKLEDAWRILAGGAAENNANKRKLALSAMVTAGSNPRVVTMAAALLKDKEVDVRQAAAAVLGEMNARLAIPKLAPALDDEAPEVSFTAALSLWKLGDRRGKDILAAVLSGERGVTPGRVKGTVRDAKNRLRDPAGLAMLGAKEGVGMFLGPASMGFTVFEELRKDGSASARTLSAAALSKDSALATTNVLGDALEDKNWLVRVAVVKALALQGNRAAVPKVEAMLEDKHEAVRYMAAAALVRLEGGPRKPVTPIAPKNGK